MLVVALLLETTYATILVDEILLRDCNARKENSIYAFSNAHYYVIRLALEYHRHRIS